MKRCESSHWSIERTTQRAAHAPVGLPSRVARPLKFVTILLAALIVAIPLAADLGAGQPPQPEASASGSCAEIRQSLTRLGQAERDQALALQIFSGGGQLSMVELRYQHLQQAGGDLREILRRVRASSLGVDPSVSECLKLGYQSLFASEKVGTEVEQILFKAHGSPLVRLGDGP